MKKIVTMIMAVSIIASSLAFNGNVQSEQYMVSADVIEKVDDSGIKYTVDENNEAVITGYTGTAASVEIPSEIDGYAVTAIGRFAFTHTEKIESVIIPEGVTEIEKCAFYWCTGLKSITLPESLTTIGDNSFVACIHLETIKIPKNVKSISESAFARDGMMTSCEIIEGYRGSYAEQYANDHYLKFIALDDDTEKLIGDLNDDGKVSAVDLVMLKDYLLNISTEKSISKFHADINSDQTVNVLDLIYLKSMILE